MSVKPENYCSQEKYQDHLLEQYKLYVELTDRISQRRMTTNAFFISIHTFLATIGTAISKNAQKDAAWIALFIVGVLSSILWYVLLDSYQKLNNKRFKVIFEMEALLPYAPYDEEWKNLSAREKPSFTAFEKWLPCIFGALYLIILCPYIWQVTVKVVESCLDWLLNFFI